MKLCLVVFAAVLLTGCTLDRIVPAPPRPQRPKPIPFKVVPRPADVVLAQTCPERGVK